MTVVDVCNRALDILGTQAIAALTDTSNEARLCSRNFDGCRRAVLRMHPWNFAITHSDLSQAVTVRVSGAGTVELNRDYRVIGTLNGKNRYGDLQTYWIQWLGAPDNKWEINGYFNNTSYEVYYSTDAVLTPDLVTTWARNSAAITAGVALLPLPVVGLPPSSDFQYQFALPSDFLRLTKVAQEIDDWRIERQSLFTDSATVKITYVADVTNVEAWDPIFLDAFAHYLAWVISYKITASADLKNQVLKDFNSILSKARFVDSVEDPKQDLDIDVWMRSRVGPSQGFVRDPMT